MGTTRERIEFRADDKTSAAFKKINNNSKRLNKEGQRINQTFGKLKGIIAGVAVGLVARKVDQVVGSVNELAKAARVAGLEAETLQELRFAFGQLADVTDQRVDEALQKFQRRIGMAVDGTGAAAKTIELMNIQLFDSQGKMRKTDDLLREVLVKLSATSDASIRAGRTSQFFGERVGPRLSQALEGGIESIDNLAQKAREMGLILSNETAAGAEEAADKIDIMKRTMGAEFNRSILKNKEAIVTLVNALTKATSGFVSATAAGVKFVEDMGRALAKAKPGGESPLEEEIRLRKEALKIMEALERKPLSRTTFDITTGRQFDPVERLKEINRRLRELNEASKERMKLSKGEAQAARRDMLDPITVDAEKIKTSLMPITIEAEKITSEFGKVKDEVEAIDPAATQLGFAFESAFEDAIIRGEGLRDVLSGILKDISRIILRTAITEPLGTAIGSAVGNLLPFGGGKAEGGRVDSGKSFLVGERGPELFTPRQSGRIISNKETMGGNVNITINAPGADEGTINRIREIVTAEVLPQAINGSVNAVRDLQRRPKFA